jgi:hypothetical protein
LRTTNIEDSGVIAMPTPNLTRKSSELRKLG